MHAYGIYKYYSKYNSTIKLRVFYYYYYYYWILVHLVFTYKYILLVIYLTNRVCGNDFTQHMPLRKPINIYYNSKDNDDDY